MFPWFWNLHFTKAGFFFAWACTKSYHRALETLSRAPVPPQRLINTTRSPTPGIKILVWTSLQSVNDPPWSWRHWESWLNGCIASVGEVCELAHLTKTLDFISNLCETDRCLWWIEEVWISNWTESRPELYFRELLKQQVVLRNVLLSKHCQDASHTCDMLFLLVTLLYVSIVLMCFS